MATLRIFFEGSIATAAQQPRAKAKVGRKGAYYRGACPTHTLGNFENVGNEIPLRKKNTFMGKKLIKENKILTFPA